jgi:hypothetical protein
MTKNIGVVFVNSVQFPGIQMIVIEKYGKTTVCLNFIRLLLKKTMYG